jgi:hypothetical protein
MAMVRTLTFYILELQIQGPHKRTFCHMYVTWLGICGVYNIVKLVHWEGEEWYTILEHGDDDIKMI